MIACDRYISEITVDSEGKDSYPFSVPAIRDFGTVELHQNVTYFVGENGSGKSTFVEALAICLGFNPEGGNRNTQFSTYETASKLHEYMTVAFTTKRTHDGFFFRAETLYNLFTKAEKERIEDPAYGWHVYDWSGRHEASHGEGHLKLFIDKMTKRGVYIFDEPEAALSPEKQMSFITILNGLILKGSQVIICTHSPIILSYPDSWIYSLDNGAPERIEYDSAGCVNLYRMFMSNRDFMIRELTKENG